MLESSTLMVVSARSEFLRAGRQAPIASHVTASCGMHTLARARPGAHVGPPLAARSGTQKAECSDAARACKGR